MTELRPISYSFLQKLALGPQYINVKEEEQDYFTVGSLVDALLTEPENVEEKFCFYTEDSIGPMVKKVIDKLHSKNKKDLKEEDILGVAKEINYGQGWKPETVIRKIKEEGEKYIKFLDDCSRKTVVTRQQYDVAMKVVASLMDDPYTRSELKPYGKDVEMMTQLKIKWSVYGFPATGRLDYLFIDHKNKVITPKDLKTTGSPVYEFPKSFIHWSYYMQASFYNNAVKQLQKDLGLSDYTIAPFKFIVESTRIIGYPMVFECSNHDIYCGEFGGVLNDGRSVKGFKKLIEDYKWYIDNDMWSHSREYIENSGKIILNAFEKTKTTGET